MTKKPLRIVFAGGGTGGHFYPAIAVAEALQTLIAQEHVLDTELYYMSDSPYDKEILEKVGFRYIENLSGKRRPYFSLWNFIDIFKIGIGCFTALIRLFALYPDVIFGKGGYASFPAMFAARILRIPVVIHESDIVPGMVNKWIGNYATKVALSYPEAVKYFAHQDRLALTGQPIRKELINAPQGDAYQTMGLEPNVPIILVIGGSQGAEKINDNVLDILAKLLETYQVVHQTGEANYDSMILRTKEKIGASTHASRYHPFPFLDVTQLSTVAHAAALVISRAGSAIFEIALWGKPSILIPLPLARNDHQRENAYSYARTGAAIVIEEQNLKPELFTTVIHSILDDATRSAQMSEATKQFAKTDAADKIAQAILAIATQHD